MDYFQGLEPNEIEALRNVFSKEKETPRDLTVERAQGLIWKGFELSQGNNHLLNYMWHWIHDHYPHYKVDSSAVADLAARLQPAFEALIIPRSNNPVIHVAENSMGTPIDKLAIESATWRNVIAFYEILDSQRQTPAIQDGTLEKTIFGLQLKADYNWLVKVGVRPGDPAKKDVYASNICDFVLSTTPNSTGYAEYDTMFAAVKEQGPEFIGYFNGGNLHDVISAYNTHHEGKEVSLQSLNKIEL